MFCGFPSPQKAIYTINLSILLLTRVQLIFLILRIRIGTTTKESIKPALNVGKVISYFPSSFLVAQRVKHLPAMQKTWVQSGFNLLGRSPGEGNGNPLQYSCLEIPMDRGVWWATIHIAHHGVAKSRT